MTTRRVFILQSVIGSGVLASGTAMAADPMVSETDPMAKGLSYVADNKNVDAKKFPKFAAAQNCSTCLQYKGKAGEATGGCNLFAGKQVTSKGWCSAWAKKA